MAKLKAASPRRRGGAWPWMRMMPGEKAQDFKGTIGKLVRFMGQFKVAFIAAIVFAMASAAFNIVGPKVLSQATTELFDGIVAKIGGTGGIDFDAVGAILLATLALYCVSAACSFVQGWMMTSVSQRTCYGLRRQIAEKIDRLPVGYFERTSTGDVLSRITNDVDTLGQSLNQGVTQLITSATTMIGVLVMMLSINVEMTLIALLVIPLSLILVKVVVKRSQRYFRAQQKKLGEINGQIEETFSGQAIVRAFNKEDAAIAAFRETNEALYQSAWRSQFLSGLMMPVASFNDKLICGCGYCGRGFCRAGSNHGGRHSGVYSICEKLHAAYPHSSLRSPTCCSKWPRRRNAFSNFSKHLKKRPNSRRRRPPMFQAMWSSTMCALATTPSIR